MAESTSVNADAAVAAALRATASAVPPAGRPLRRLPKLLVVDDQPVNIQALYETFHADHQVYMATRGEQAIAVCRAQLPDLVLLDVLMPGIDGYEVCARLKADPLTASIPVMFVTGQSDEVAETRGLDAGAVDFIVKPINPKVVRARVKTHLTLKAQADLLREMAFVDGLTGVANRRRFDERLVAELGRARRDGTALAVILIDVDFFKRYNDRYGHLAGDDCLRRVAGALAGGLHRAGDLLARYGGEEFACVLPESDLDGARRVAERLEQAVRTLAMPHADSEVDRVVTVSLGVAVSLAPREGSAERLLGLADARLYDAKAGGRGRACVGSEAGPLPA